MKSQIFTKPSLCFFKHCIVYILKNLTKNVFLVSESIFGNYSKGLLRSTNFIQVRLGEGGQKPASAS